MAHSNKRAGTNPAVSVTTIPTEARRRISNYLSSYPRSRMDEVQAAAGKPDWGPTDRALMNTRFQNLALGYGLQDAVANALGDMIEEGEVRLEPCSPLVYLAGGSLMPDGVKLFRSRMANPDKMERAMAKLRVPHWVPMLVSLRSAQ